MNLSKKAVGLCMTIFGIGFALMPVVQANAFVCGSTVTFNYNGSNVTYGSITSSTGKCWLDRNLGASRVATAYNDSASFGDLFQWGRGIDGHQLRTSSVSSTLATSPTSAGSSFIVHASGSYDWLAIQDNSLWQGINGTNNPCPISWRLPTQAEWQAEISAWSSPFASALKLPSGSYRDSNTGSIQSGGTYGDTYGNYWSSSIMTGPPYEYSYSFGLQFYGSIYGYSSTMVQTNRAYGMSIRCVLDTTPVDGTCGTAAKVYAYDASAFSGTMCGAGSGVTTPASPAFPAQGGSTTWTCGGLNGGNSSPTCTATRLMPPGQCGGANTHRFLSTDTAYTTTYNQCNLGTSTNTTFPTGGTPSNWYCNNSGSNSPQCTASRNRKATITNGTLTYSVNTSGNVTFTGFSSADADGDARTYAWVCTNGGTFTNNAVANPQYIAPSTARTDTCTLVVSDGYEGTLSSTVTVTVNTPSAGQCGEASGHRFYSTDTAYTTTYDQCNLGTSTNTTFPTGGTPSNWYCNNSGVNSAQCTATRNRKPVITTGTLTYSVTVSGNVTFTGFSVTDADSDTLSYAWVCANGGTFTNNAAVNPQYIAPSTARTDTCTLVVSDGYEGTTSSTVTVSVNSALVNGVCGTANGQSFISSGDIDTAAERCASGIFGGSFTDSPTTWTWSCNGSGGGTSDNGCYANKSGVIVNGQCGVSDDNVFASIPTNDLCISGTTSSVSGSGPWTWTCAGIGSGAQSEACNANVSGTNFNGACGSANGHSSTTVPTTNLCSAASGGEPTPSGTGPWTWTCLGGGTGSNASCSANKSLPIWTEK